MEGHEIIDESENWNGQSQVGSYREIVMSQFSRVVRNMSQEMRPGFYVYSNSAPGISSKPLRYIGDSRHELIQSLDCLHDILAPKFDENMKNSSKSLLKKIEEKKSKYSEEKETNFYIDLLKIYRSLFQEICKFLESLGWLEGGSIID